MEHDEVVWDWQRNAVPLLEEEEGILKLTPEGVSLLTGFAYPVVVICVVGCRQRQSLFNAAIGCSHSDAPEVLEQKQTIFFMGSADFMRSGRCVIILNLHLGPSWNDLSSSLIDLAMVLSSVMVHCDESHTDFPEIEAILNFAHSLHMEKKCTPEELKRLLPSFFWITAASVSTGEEAFMPLQWPQGCHAEYGHELSKIDHIGTYIAGNFHPAVPKIILRQSRVKAIFGAELTGDMLVALVDGCLAQIDQIDLLGSWNRLVGLKCQDFAASALASYVDVMQDAVMEVPPMELTTMDKLHLDLAQMATSMFASHASQFKKAPARRQAKVQLHADIHKTFLLQRSRLIEHSRTHCQAVAAKVASEYLDNNKNDDTFGVRLKQGLSTYEAEAKGPGSYLVLATFLLEDVLPRMQAEMAAEKRAWTDAHLCDERQRLEAAYAEKHAALLAHFQQEAVTLRQQISQEQAIWQRAAVGKEARKNVDVSQAKRLQEEHAVATKKIVTLEESLRKMKATVEEWQAKCSDLTVQMTEQTAVLDNERNMHASLVENLAESIRHEKAAQDELAEVRERSQERERELRLQLQTVTEVNLIRRHIQYIDSCFCFSFTLQSCCCHKYRKKTCSSES
jgi:hypothetical protein